VVGDGGRSSVYGAAARLWRHGVCTLHASGEEPEATEVKNLKENHRRGWREVEWCGHWWVIGAGRGEKGGLGNWLSEGKAKGFACVKEEGKMSFRRETKLVNLDL
jgi:hypothetical protein